MKKWLTTAMVLLMAVAMLTGCGQASGTSGANILRVGWTSEPDILNPLTSYSTESMQVTNLIYETLLAYDTNLEPYPALAESYEYSEDGLTATYHLRQGVKWQDGVDFTAKDVVTSFRLVMDYEIGPAAQFAAAVDSVTAPDDYTVEIKYKEKQAFNIALALQILPDHIWGEMSADDVEMFANESPVGTGPMKFVEWQEGSTLTLARNETYHGDPAGPDQIIFIEYGNEDVLAQALKAGEVDIITEVSPTVWEGLASAEGVNAVSLDSFSFHMIGINSYDSEKSGGNPMLRDVTVRQALNYAVDRNQLVEIALAGHGNPGDTIIPLGMGDWHYTVPESEQMNGNPEKAKELLDAAGYVDTDGDGIREKDGQKMEFRLYAIESTTVDVRAAQIFRDACAAIGVSMVLTTMDENTMGDAIFDPETADYDLFVWGWDTNFLDPGDLLSIALTNQFGNNNDSYYSNPEYDALYVQQGQELDQAARQSIVHEMQKIFYRDGSYIVMWFQDKLQAYRTDNWTGFVECPGGIIYNVTYDNYVKIEPTGK